MAWQQLIIKTHHPQQAEALTTLLESLGALAITHAASNEQEIFEPEIGTTPLWEQTTLTALFPVNVDSQRIINEICSAIPSTRTRDMRWEKLADQAWERAWMDDFKPIDFGHDLWIVPSWLPPPNPNACNILLDPGLAFGTGTHPTTHLCLSWIAAAPIRDANILDYGCGSGILGIACALRGAKSVWAIDIDPQAVTATNDNRQRNHINDGIIQAGLTESLPQQLQADITIANILTKPLLFLAPTLAQHTRQGGEIILSGILDRQADEVISSYSKWFEFDSPCFKEGWVLLHGKKS